MRVTDHIGPALKAIRNSIRNHPQYKVERENVVQYVATKVKGKSVEEMRAMGGFSSIITYAILHLANDYNMGTAMIPWTHQNEMASDLQSIRHDAQRLNNAKV